MHVIGYFNLLAELHVIDPRLLHHLVKSVTNEDNLSFILTLGRLSQSQTLRQGEQPRVLIRLLLESIGDLHERLGVSRVKPILHEQGIAQKLLKVGRLSLHNVF